MECWWTHSMRAWFIRCLMLMLGCGIASAAAPIAPLTNEVVRYRWERARPVFRSGDIPKHRGDALLALLNGGSALEERKLPPGFVCSIPPSADWWLTVTHNNGVTSRIG